MVEMLVLTQQIEYVGQIDRKLLYEMQGVKFLTIKGEIGDANIIEFMLAPASD